MLDSHWLENEKGCEIKIFKRTIMARCIVFLLAIGANLCVLLLCRLVWKFRQSLEPNFVVSISIGVGEEERSSQRGCLEPKTLTTTRVLDGNLNKKKILNRPGVNSNRGSQYRMKIRSWADYFCNYWLLLAGIPYIWQTSSEWSTNARNVSSCFSNFPRW